MRPELRPYVEETGEPEAPDHEGWERAKVLRALEEARDPGNLIPIEELWRRLQGED